MTHRRPAGARERLAKLINEMRIPFPVVEPHLPAGKRVTETTAWQTLSTDEIVEMFIKALGQGERINTLEGESFRVWRVPPAKPAPSPLERWDA